MKKKISKVKYALMNIDYYCPECHKRVDERLWTCSSLEGWGPSYSNTCPHCRYSFDNTELLMFPHVEQYFPNAPKALVALLDDTFFLTLNCNDLFCPACCWDEEIEEDVITLYYVLTTKEKLDPDKTLDAIRQWMAGQLSYGKKFPSKELKQIRKLTGWKWYPQECKRNIQ